MKKGEPLLKGDQITDLHLDQNSILWIACNKGIFVLDIASGNFKAWDFPKTLDKNYEARVIF